MNWKSALLESVVGSAMVALCFKYGYRFGMIF